MTGTREEEGGKGRSREVGRGEEEEWEKKGLKQSSCKVDTLKRKHQ